MRNYQNFHHCNHLFSISNYSDEFLKVTKYTQKTIFDYTSTRPHLCQLQPILHFHKSADFLHEKVRKKNRLKQLNKNRNGIDFNTTLLLKKIRHKRKYFLKDSDNPNHGKGWDHHFYLWKDWITTVFTFYTTRCVFFNYTSIKLARIIGHTK